MAVIRDPFAQMRQTLAPEPVQPKPVSPMEWTAQQATKSAPSSAPPPRPAATQYVPPKVDPVSGAYANRGPVPPTAGAAAPTGAAPKPAMPSTGGIRRAGEAMKSGAANLVKSPAKTLAYGAGNLTAKVVKGAPLALGAHTVSHFNDYKIDDPGVDSSASGVLGALTRGDFAGAGEGMKKGAVEAMMDLGAAGADLLDYVVPGKAPVSSAYDRMLRNDLGSILVKHGEGDTAAQPAAAAAQPAATAAQPAAPTQPAATPAVDPGPMGPMPHPDITKDLAKVPRDLPESLRDGFVYKTKDANGRTVYSGRNVKEGANMLDGSGHQDLGQLGGPRGVPSLRTADVAQPVVQAAQPAVQAAAAPAQAAQPAAAAAGTPTPVTTVNKTMDAAGNVTYSGNSTRPAAAPQSQAQAAQPQAQAQAAAPQPQAQAAPQPASPSLDFDTSRGAVSTLPKGVSPFAPADSDGALSAARQAAAARGDWDAVSRSYGDEGFQGGQGGPSLRMGGGGYSAGPSVPAHVAQSEKFARQAARSDAESAARAAIKSGSVRERGRGMATLAQLAGGDQDAATSRYNTDATAATTRYGSDNSLRGQVYSADSQNDASRYTADMGLRNAYAKNMPAQMQRQAQSMAMQMANGDIPTALRILAQNGYSGEGLIATQNALNSDQTTQQNLYKGAEEGAMARFKNFVPTDAEGKPVYGGEAQVMNAIESAVPGYSRMGADAQARYAPTVQSTLSIIKGLNTTANNSLLQTIGWDPANPRIDQLPGLNGAKLGQVGKLSGILPGDGVSSGDYSLDLGGGRVLYLPRDQIGENELALLRAKGVNIPQ